MENVANTTPEMSGAVINLASNGDASLFTEMREAFEQLDHEPLRGILLDSLISERHSVQAIARGFAGFLAGIQALDIRRQFFASWQRTNNSALSVEGLANRMTQEGEAKCESLDAVNALRLFRAAGRMNRIADEDLGVGGGTLHFELYYRMATACAGRDDQWQSRRYCLPAAEAFKSWLDAMRLRAPILVGLYSLLVHEGYTHAELETIAAPFHEWATSGLGLSLHEARQALAWITVHTGGTEKNHFAHSCASLMHYLEGSGTLIDLGVAGETFRTYLQLKGAVMAQLNETYH
ncbi:MAG TPA: hypothetical protein VMK12_10125 [Anaeromyxobacteraceae bacterium]|nr:hypothetical protein [Anaeromyxobacteraceae bacterium]